MKKLAFVADKVKTLLPCLFIFCSFIGVFAGCTNKIIKTADADQDLIEVSYLDYGGNVQKGKLAVDKDTKNNVMQLFNDLLTAKFQIFKLGVVPAKDAVAFDNALEENLTFSFYTYDSAAKEMVYGLMINPLSNPRLERRYSNKKQAPAQAHPSLLSDAPTMEITVSPYQSIYNINHRIGPLKGKIETSITALFEKNGFSRFTSNGSDVAYFGVFIFKAPAVKKPVPSPARIVNNSSYSPAKFSPLPPALKDTLIAKGKWKKGCPVPLERLNLVEFSYYNADMTPQNGTLIVADILAPHLCKIVDSLYERKFPLEKPDARGDNPDPITGPGGTGAFICRKITDGDIFSLHSYGTAIDISFFINPFIGAYNVDKPDQKTSVGTVVLPNVPLGYFVRDQKNNVGFSEHIVDLMHNNGYIEWGGEWSSRTDYMHFQSTPFLSYLFPSLDKLTGQKLLTASMSYPDSFKRLSIDLYPTELTKWIYLYQLYPSEFGDTFVANMKNFTPSMTTNDFMLLMYKDLATPSK